MVPNLRSNARPRVSGKGGRVTIVEVVNRRRAVLMERARVAEQLQMFDVTVAAAICEEMAFLVDLLRAHIDEIKRDAG
jgi:hypothetical protein